MIRTKIDKETSVENIPQIIVDYFNDLSTVPDTHFIVAGYSMEEAEKKQLIYKINVKTKTIEKQDTSSQGATWMEKQRH
mgnify:FL=1